jgi:hypothetical protein
MKKHPAEPFLIATREERAARMADMPPMVSVVFGVAGILQRLLRYACWQRGSDGNTR